MAAQPRGGGGGPPPGVAAWRGGGPQAVRGRANPGALHLGHDVGLDHVPAAPYGRAPGAAADPPQTCKKYVKTQICKHQLRGFCKYQDKCQFAHSREELKASASKLCATCLSPGCSKERCPGPRSFADLGGGAAARGPSAGGRPAAGAAAPAPPGRSAPGGPAAEPHAHQEVMNTVQRAMYEAAQQAAQMVLREAMPLLEQQTGQARGSMLVDRASEQAVTTALWHGGLQAGAPTAEPAAPRAAAPPGRRPQQPQQRQHQSPPRRQQQQRQSRQVQPQPPASAGSAAAPGPDAAWPRQLAEMRMVLAERTSQLSKPEVGEKALLCSALCEIVELLQEEEEGLSESGCSHLAGAGRAEASAPPSGGAASAQAAPAPPLRRVRPYARGDDELPAFALPGGGLPLAGGPEEGPLTLRMLAELSRLVGSGCS